IGIWRLRPLVRMVGRCAAPPATASPSASAKASASRTHRADASVRRMRGSYNDFVLRTYVHLPASVLVARLPDARAGDDYPRARADKDRPRSRSLIHGHGANQYPGMLLLSPDGATWSLSSPIDIASRARVIPLPHRRACALLAREGVTVNGLAALPI